MDYLGFEKADALGFGDGDNDVAMFNAVGTSVAMGNAKDKVKACADLVCKSVEDDGVYHYLLEEFKFKSFD